MQGMLLGMIGTLMTWALLLPACIGFGLLCFRLVRARPRRPEEMLLAFWPGWCLVVAALQIWHFFQPINQTAFWAIVGMGWFLLAALGESRKLRARALVRRNLAFLVASCVLTLWLSNGSLGPGSNYDTGLYHLSSIRWCREYPVVIGLGNLHGRLAFNSLHFLYMALVEASPWSLGAQHGSHGMLLLVVGLQILLSVRRMLAPGAPIRGNDVVRMLLALFWYALCIQHVAGTSTDLPYSVISLVVVCELARLVLDRGQRSDLIIGFTVVVLLAVLGVTAKLSSVVFGILSVLSASIIVLRRLWSDREYPVMRLLVPVAGLGLLILIPWMVRGVMLSGHIAYPSPVGRMPVAWLVSWEQVTEECRLVKVFARTAWPTAQTLTSFEWLWPWLLQRLRMNFVFVMPLAFAAGAFLALAPVLLKRKGAAVDLILLAGPTVGALLFWLYAGPHPRFAGVTLWALGPLLVGMGLRADTQPMRGRAWRWCLGICLVMGAVTLLILDLDLRVLLVGTMAWGGSLGLIAGLLATVSWPCRVQAGAWLLLVMLMGIISVKIYPQCRMQVAATRCLFLVPGPAGGAYPPHLTEIQVKLSRCGMPVYLPRTGTQCWDAPLPCTPALNDNLVFRVPGDMAKGFVVRGAEP